MQHDTTTYRLKLADRPKRVIASLLYLRYVPFEGNYYWVPGTQRPQVKLLQYADRVKLFLQRVCVAEYP
ncbi:hypothetical protein FJY94_09605, partial [Candidatus Kaiserbacteria bacterium]|nr:hypothetical protein [Candidatus Kaiserbacteria bacterium]